MRRLEPLELNSEALDELKSFAGSRSLPHGLVLVLLSHEGLNNTAVAKQLSITRATVGTWRERYRQQGLIGLYDELRPGKPRGDCRASSQVGGTHWSCRAPRRVWSNVLRSHPESPDLLRRQGSISGLTSSGPSHYMESTEPICFRTWRISPRSWWVSTLLRVPRNDAGVVTGSRRLAVVVLHAPSTELHVLLQLLPELEAASVRWSRAGLSA